MQINVTVILPCKRKAHSALLFTEALSLEKGTQQGRSCSWRRCCLHHKFTLFANTAVLCILIALVQQISLKILIIYPKMEAIPKFHMKMCLPHFCK